MTEQQWYHKRNRKWFLEKSRRYFEQNKEKLSKINRY